MVRASLNAKQLPPSADEMASRAEFQPPIITPFTVLVDSQEAAGNHAGWNFHGMLANADNDYRQVIVKTKVRKLETGDYTIEGLEHYVAIERKSLNDLLGSIVTQPRSQLGPDERARRDRLEDEHIRMQQIIRAEGIACLIIEADLAQYMNNPPPASGVSPRSVLGTQTAWYARYKVPWLWAGSRAQAEELCYWTLWKAWEHWESMGGDVWDSHLGRAGKCSE